MMISRVVVLIMPVKAETAGPAVSEVCRSRHWSCPVGAYARRSREQLPYLIGHGDRALENDRAKPFLMNCERR